MFFCIFILLNILVEYFEDLMRLNMVLDNFLILIEVFLRYCFFKFLVLRLDKIFEYRLTLLLLIFGLYGIFNLLEVDGVLEVR